MSRIDAIHTFGERNPAGLDTRGLERALAKFSDKDLDKLADELDFCSFSGLPSARILAVLDDLGELDATWTTLYRRMVSKVA